MTVWVLRKVVGSAGQHPLSVILATHVPFLTPLHESASFAGYVFSDLGLADREGTRLLLPLCRNTFSADCCLSVVRSLVRMEKVQRELVFAAATFFCRFQRSRVFRSAL